MTKSHRLRFRFAGANLRRDAVSQDRREGEKMNKKPKKINTGWGAVAAWYDTLLRGEGTYQKEVILPNLVHLLEPLRNRTIADIGCGQGFFAFALAEGGATVSGFDISLELIAQAQKSAGKHPALKVFFNVAKAHALPSQEGVFNTALCILSLQNILEYREALAEAGRVLQKEGEIFIVLNHPAFRIPNGSSWGFDEGTQTQYRRIDRYALPFSSTIDMTPGTKNPKEKKYTVSFHRPLQDYVKALTKAGFGITGLEEWHSHKTSRKGPRAKAEDTARKEFPLFLMLRAKKAHQ